MLAFLLLTGLQLGEALGLQWSVVDMERGSLWIRRSLSYVGGDWHEGRPKTRAREQAVALPSLVLGLLAGLGGGCCACSGKTALPCPAQAPSS